MLRNNLCTFVVYVASTLLLTAAADSGDASAPVAPDTELRPPLLDAPRSFQTEDKLIGDDHHEESHMLHDDHSENDLPLVDSEMTSDNTTEHDEINALLGHDEERVLAKGVVQVRKKRFLCRRCFPTVSYGYGGGGGCCGACGGCGGGRRIRVIAVPVYSGYGGGGGCGGGCGCGGCGGGCNVCGRK